MTALKESGSVGRIGVSVYTAAEIDGICRRFPVDMVQLPVSVLDQRLLASGHLRLLKDRGVEVHARSVFLQGLLLSEPENLPDYFRTVRDSLAVFRARASEHGMSAIEAALQFALRIPEIDCVLVGVCDAPQLAQIVAAASSRA